MSYGPRTVTDLDFNDGTSTGVNQFRGLIDEVYS